MDKPSMWQSKPWWCQPWTILLSGCGFVGGSWAVFEKWWITAPVSFAIAVWWFVFLYLVPKAYQDAGQP
ncbi:MAG: DUF6737 family protein [Cyanobacteria bacterium P01_H01_bin.15]